MLTDLLPEYKQSKKLLHSRINELAKIKIKLESVSLDPKKDPEVIEIAARLKPLQNMYDDLADVTTEIENYYELRWYRSPDYGFNRQRKGEKYCYDG